MGPGREVTRSYECDFEQAFEPAFDFALDPAFEHAFDFDFEPAFEPAFDFAFEPDFEHAFDFAFEAFGALQVGFGAGAQRGGGGHGGGAQPPALASLALNVTIIGTANTLARPRPRRRSANGRPTVD